MTEQPKPKLPTIHDLAELIKAIKPDIADEYIDDEDTIPGIDVTIGCDPETGRWSYQTGDNSFTGGAYHYPIWGVGRIYRRTNSRDLARDLIDQIADQYYQ
jgi:hypothetical protein